MISVKIKITTDVAYLLASQLCKANNAMITMTPSKLVIPQGSLKMTNKPQANTYAFITFYNYFCESYLNIFSSWISMQRRKTVKLEQASIFKVRACHKPHRNYI